MNNINEVTLIGRTGADPEVRITDSGISVASVSLATTEKRGNKDTGEETEETEWHKVIMWRGLADVVGKYVKKGDPLYIRGKIKTRRWEKDGITKYATEIVASDMIMLGTKKT